MHLVLPDYLESDEYVINSFFYIFSLAAQVESEKISNNIKHK